MKELALTAYGFFCTLIPAIALFAILHARYKTEGIKEPRLHFLKVLVLSCYIAGVFYVTGTGTVFHIRQYGLKAMATEYNLLPFFSGEIDGVGYLLNVILFVPLGFLLPLIWPNKNSFKKILLWGASFSLLIELSQLLNCRNSDIDDLLLNTFGAVAGFLLYRLFAAVWKRGETPDSGYRLETLLYIGTMFLGRFLLFDELGFAKILYGF